MEYVVEDFELPFVFHSQRSEVFGSCSSKIAIIPQIPKKARSNSALRWRYQLNKVLFKVNHGVGDFGFLDYFSYAPSQITQFPQITLMPLVP